MIIVLSICVNAIEFSRHEFPSFVVENMDVMGGAAFSHNMSYDAA